MNLVEIRDLFVSEINPETANRPDVPKSGLNLQLVLIFLLFFQIELSLCELQPIGMRSCGLAGATSRRSPACGGRSCMRSAGGIAGHTGTTVTPAHTSCR